jgi:methyl-accepting chemotaxis protein
MAAHGFRRKKVLVDRGLQLRFAKFVIMFVFVACLLTGLTIFYTTFLLLGERLAQVYPQGRLVDIFRTVHIAFFVNLVVILPFIFYGSIVFSHRVAGPLPKIYQGLRNIGEGNFEVRLVLRKNDELRELADVINQMAKNLKERETRK